MKKLIIFVVIFASAMTTQAQNGNSFLNSSKTVSILFLIVFVIGLYIVLKRPIIKESENSLDNEKEVKLTMDEQKEIEKGNCITCENIGTVKGLFNEEKKHAEHICSKCGSIYHQYDGYGNFFYQIQTNGA